MIKIFHEIVSKMRACLKCEEGSLVVELTIALPILMLILFSCLDLARYIQLAQNVEQAAELVVDTVSVSKNGEADESLFNGLALAKSILKYGSSYPHISVMAESFKLDPSGNKTVFWSDEKGTGTYSCGGTQNTPKYGNSDLDTSSPSQYFTRVYLCVMTKKDFFSSQYLPLENLELFSITYRPQVAGFGVSQL